MANFMSGFFLGIIIGLGLGIIFFWDKIVEVKTLGDDKTEQLLKLLDLAEGEND